MVEMILDLPPLTLRQQLQTPPRDHHRRHPRLLLILRSMRCRHLDQIEGCRKNLHVMATTISRKSWACWYRRKKHPHVMNDTFTSTWTWRYFSGTASIVYNLFFTRYKLQYIKNSCPRVVHYIWDNPLGYQYIWSFSISTPWDRRTVHFFYRSSKSH